MLLFRCSKGAAAFANASLRRHYPHQVRRVFLTPGYSTTRERPVGPLRCRLELTLSACAWQAANSRLHERMDPGFRVPASETSSTRRQVLKKCLPWHCFRSLRYCILGVTRNRAVRDNCHRLLLSVSPISRPDSFKWAGIRQKFGDPL